MHILPTDAAAAAVVAALSASGSPHLWPYVYTHTWCIYVCIYPLSARMGYILGKIFFLFSPKRPKKRKKRKKFLYKFEKFVERLIEIIALLGEMLEAAQQVLGKKWPRVQQKIPRDDLAFLKGKKRATIIWEKKRFLTDTPL